MNFTIADIIQIVILIGGICVSIGVWKNELKNLKKKHCEDVKLLQANEKELGKRISKTDSKVDKMEVAIVDLRWIKEAVAEIKIDLKEIKNKK